MLEMSVCLNWITSPLSHLSRSKVLFALLPRLWCFWSSPSRSRRQFRQPCPRLRICSVCPSFRWRSLTVKRTSSTRVRRFATGQCQHCQKSDGIKDIPSPASVANSFGLSRQRRYSWMARLETCIRSEILKPNPAMVRRFRRSGEYVGRNNHCEGGR